MRPSITSRYTRSEELGVKDSCPYGSDNLRPAIAATP